MSREGHTARGRPQVVVVTGASSGIGRATARLAAARGDHVVLDGAGSREPRRGRRASATTTARRRAWCVPVDVGDDEAVRRAFDEVLRRHGQVDVVVSCAGVVAYGRLEDVPVEVFDGVLRTNLHGSANLARHVVPQLRRQGHGTLVLVGSVIGHIAVPAMSAYVLSKWGVRALARQLRVENRDLDDVHVVYVAPGGVDTPIYQQAGNYSGFEGRPPPPVASPERVARQVLARVDHPRRHEQLLLANDVIRFGFNVLPGVYRALVAPLFGVAAVDLGRPVAPTTGNVTASRGDQNALHGHHGSAVLGIARNLRAKLGGGAAETPAPALH